MPSGTQFYPNSSLEGGGSVTKKKATSHTKKKRKRDREQGNNSSKQSVQNDPDAPRTRVRHVLLFQSLLIDVRAATRLRVQKPRCLSGRARF